MGGKRGCLGFLFGKKDGSSAEAARLPYRVRDNFLTPAEYSFYKVLRLAVGETFAVCPKVNLKDIFFVTMPEKNLHYYNNIDHKQIDFLLCDIATMDPALGVELDDKSHERKERDYLVEEVFDAARLPLGRVFAAASYNPTELRAYLFEAAGLKEEMQEKAAAGEHLSHWRDTEFDHVNLAKKDEAAQETAGESPKNKPLAGENEGAVRGAGTIPVRLSLEEIAKAVQETAAAGPKGKPVCPMCKVEMVLQTSKRGTELFVCANFPRCRQVRGLYE